MNSCNQTLIKNAASVPSDVNATTSLVLPHTNDIMLISEEKNLVGWSMMKMAKEPLAISAGNGEHYFREPVECA